MTHQQTLEKLVEELEQTTRMLRAQIAEQSTFEKFFSELEQLVKDYNGKVDVEVTIAHFTNDDGQSRWGVHAREIGTFTGEGIGEGETLAEAIAECDRDWQG